jgi:hypothetical protein
MVFTTRLSGGKGGRNGFENELRRPGITQINSTPNHPTTCGKIERFHQTLKNGSPANPAPPPSPNCKTNSTPSSTNTTTTAPTAPCRTKPPPPPPTPPAPKPTQQPAPTPTTGSAPTASTKPASSPTLRVAGRLHHIGVGRTYTGTRVLVLIQDLRIRIINAATGELLRELTLDPTKDYQPTGAPKGPKRKQFRT